MTNVTINVQDDELHGQTLVLGNSPSTTTNPITLNLTDAKVTALLEGQTNVEATINANGHNTLNLTHEKYNASALTVNFAPGASLTTRADLDVGSYTVNQGKLRNVETTLQGTHAVINADVVGIGSFNDDAGQFGGGYLEFGQHATVKAGQSINVSGDLASQYASVLKIDDLAASRGSVNMGIEAEVDLAGLKNVDSYSFRNDILRLYDSGGTRVDALKLLYNASEGGQSYAMTVTKSAAGTIVIGEQGLTGYTPLAPHAGLA